MSCGFLGRTSIQSEDPSNLGLYAVILWFPPIKKASDQFLDENRDETRETSQFDLLEEGKQTSPTIGPVGLPIKMHTQM